MKNRIFVDSWGWITLANQGEESHTKIRDFYHREKLQKTAMVTTDYVLDEVMTFLFIRLPFPTARQYIEELLASIAGNFVQLERIGKDRFQEAWKMRLAYQDKPKISFTDFTSFVVMKEMGIKKVLTNDHHFTIVGLGFEIVP